MAAVMGISLHSSFRAEQSDFSLAFPSVHYENEFSFWVVREMNPILVSVLFLSQHFFPKEHISEMYFVLKAGSSNSRLVIFSKLKQMQYTPVEGNKKSVGNVLLISMRNMPIISHCLCICYTYTAFYKAEPKPGSSLILNMPELCMSTLWEVWCRIGITPAQRSIDITEQRLPVTEHRRCFLIWDTLTVVFL